MTSRDKEFRSVLKTSYVGFCVDEESRFPKQFLRFFECFRAVGEGRRVSVRRDATSWSGNTCARTFVKRTLLGVQALHTSISVFVCLRFLGTTSIV